MLRFLRQRLHSWFQCPVGRVAVIVLLALVALESLPRWEIHAHSHSDDVAQVHALSSDNGHLHDADECPASGADQLHVHVLNGSVSSLPEVAALEVPSLPAQRYVAPARTVPARTVVGPPPHRPPIA